MTVGGHPAEASFSFYYVGLGDGTQVISLGSKSLYPLSYLPILKVLEAEIVSPDLLLFSKFTVVFLACVSRSLWSLITSASVTFWAY